MYKFLDYQHDRESLNELFSISDKARIKSMLQVTDDIHEHPSIVRLFEYCPFIPRNKYNVELGVIDSYVPPYISPGNNGLIIFPVSGSLNLNFYSYIGTRETLSPFKWKTKSMLAEIESTLTETITVDSPLAFDGLIPHSYGSSTESVLIAILKIPLDIDWNSILW